MCLLFIVFFWKRRAVWYLLFVCWHSVLIKQLMPDSPTDDAILKPNWQCNEK